MLDPCNPLPDTPLLVVFLQFPAPRTDFLFARAMGYTGAQLADSDGVTVGTDFQQYSYLDGRVKHFKDIGGTHGSTFGNAVTKDEVTKAILGTA